MNWFLFAILYVCTLLLTYHGGRRIGYIVGYDDALIKKHKELEDVIFLKDRV